MPTDPVTGQLLPYDGGELINPYDGPWPPDPSWDESPVPDVALAPEALQARAAADALFAEEPQVQLGMPRPVAESSVAPVDESLITMGDGEPEAPPLTDEERAARLDEITNASPGLGTAAQDVESPDLLDPFGETLQQRTDQLSDFELAQKQYLSDQAAEEQRQANVLRAAQADRQAAEEDERIYRGSLELANKQQAEIDAEASRLATEKVDPDGWRNSRSTFQTIAMFVAGIVGGLIQSKTGGRNLGIEMIDREIERHIQGQRENIAHRRQMLGDRRVAVQDDRAQAEATWKTEAAFRQAAWQRAFEEAEEKKQQFDQAGNTARQYTMFQRDLQARAAAAQQAHFDAIRKQSADELRLLMDAQKHDADIAYKQAQTAKLKGGGGSGAGGIAAAGKVKRTPADWKKLYPDLDIPDDGIPRNEKEFTQLLGTVGKADQLKKAKQERDDFERTNKVKGPQGDLRTSDGRIYVPPTDISKEIRQHMNATTQLISMLDEVDAIRARVGGESKWGNSADFQRLETLQENIVKVAKGGTEGMSSDADMARLAASMGAKDLTSFRSQAARITQARARLVEAQNGELYNVGNYDGPPVVWPNTQASGKTKLTAKEKAVQALIAEDAGNDQSNVPTAAAATGPLGATVKAVDWGYGKLASKEKASPENETRMRALIKSAQKGDEASIQGLRDVAERSGSTDFRNQAAAALMVIDFMQRTPDEKETAKEREDEAAFLKEGE